jgi:transposase-like protein
VNSFTNMNGGFSTASPVLGPERREVERSETERSDGPKTAPLPDPEVIASPSRRRFTATYKQRVLREAEACRGTGQIAALLRREGLYSSHLTAWRKSQTRTEQQALAPRQRGRKPTDPALSAQIEQNRRLTRENARLEQRLAQAEAIIDIQKKVSALLGIPLNHPDSEGSD